MSRQSFSQTTFSPAAPEPGENLVNLVLRRRFSIPQLVIHFEFLPFIATELMERQHVHSLDVAELCGEVRHAPDFIHIVRKARHNDKPNPDRPFSRSETPGEFMHWFMIHTGDLTVQLGRNCL